MTRKQWALTAIAVTGVVAGVYVAAPAILALPLSQLPATALSAIANHAWAVAASGAMGALSILFTIRQRVQRRNAGKDTAGSLLPSERDVVKAFSESQDAILQAERDRRAGLQPEVAIYGIRDDKDRRVSLLPSPMGGGMELVMEGGGRVFSFYSKTADGLLELLGMKPADGQSHPVEFLGHVGKDNWRGDLNVLRLRYQLNNFDPKIANSHPIAVDRPDGSIEVQTNISVTHIKRIPLEGGKETFQVDYYLDPDHKGGLMTVPQKGKPLDSVPVNTRQEAEAVAMAFQFAQRSLLALAQGGALSKKRMEGMLTSLMSNIAHDLKATAKDVVKEISDVHDPVRAASTLARLSLESVQDDMGRGLKARLIERVVESIAGKAAPAEFTPVKGTLSGRIARRVVSGGKASVIVDMEGFRAELASETLTPLDLTKNLPPGTVMTTDEVHYDDGKEIIDPRVLSFVDGVATLHDTQIVRLGKLGRYGVNASGLLATVFTRGDSNGIVLVDRLPGRNAFDWMPDNVKELVGETQLGLLQKEGLPDFIRKLFDEPLIQAAAENIQRNWQKTHIRQMKGKDPEKWESLAGKDQKWIEDNKGKYDETVLRQKNGVWELRIATFNDPNLMPPSWQERVARWKDLTEKDQTWVEAHKEKYVREGALRQQNGVWQLDVARFSDHKQMAPSRIEDNRKSARIAVDLIMKHPNVNRDTHRALQHDHWTARVAGKRDANKDLVTAYGNLSEEDRERVSAVVDGAHDAIMDPSNARVLCRKNGKVYVMRRSDVEAYQTAGAEFEASVNKAVKVISSRRITSAELNIINLARPHWTGKPSAGQALAAA